MAKRLSEKDSDNRKGLDREPESFWGGMLSRLGKLTAKISSMQVNSQKRKLKFALQTRIKQSDAL